MLEHLCRLDPSEETREALVEHAYDGGDIEFDDEEESVQRILRLIALAVSTREFQFE